MKFKITIILISILFLQKEVYAHGCASGPFYVAPNCNNTNSLNVCVAPGGNSDEPQNTDYTWNFGDGTTVTISNIASSMDTICHTYAAAGTYTITLTMVVHQGFPFWTDVTCVCTGQVVVGAPPFSYTVTESFDCNANTGDLTLSYSPPGANVKWDWDPDTLNTSVYPIWPFSKVINTSDVNTSITTTAGEQHSILIQYGDCFYMETYTIVGFSLSAASTDISCYNANDGTTTATVNGGTAPYTFTWPTGSVQTNTKTSTVNNLSAGTYTVQATDATGCTATQAVTIVNPQPIISDAGPDITICTATTGNIGTTTTVGYTYSWASTTGLSDATISNPTVTLTNSGTAPLTTTYTVTTSDGSCFTTDQVNVTVNALPSADAGPDQTICSSTLLLVGSIAGTATSGTWSGGTGTFNPNNTTLTANYNPSAAEITAGTVTLTLTTDDPIGPCPAATDQMVITINPLVVVSAGPDQTICIGNTATLAGVASGSATSGTWTGGTGTYNPNNTSPNAVYTPSLAEATAGTATLTYTTNDPAGPCPALNDQMLITINQLPTANAGSAQYVCSGSTIPLAGSVGGSATTGTWSGGTGTYSPNNTTLNAIYTPSAAEYAADSVKLTLTTNDPAGPCTFSLSNVTFYFYKNPVVNFTVNDPAGCPIHCVDFTDNSSVGGGDNLITWAWSFGDGSTANQQNPSHCYSQTGFYDVSLTATSNHGCATTLTIPQMIQVYALPVAEFNPTPNPATVLDPSITMYNLSSPDVNYWHWSFGDGTTLAPNTANPIHVYPNEVSSSYIVTLIVHNANDCYDTVSHEIFIGPEFTFFIPNAFSPNEDGVNDYFFGSGIGIVDYDLWIFDRWGDMIFHGKDLNDKWNGKANYGSEIAQQDVYVWKVRLTDVFSKKHHYIGTVTIVK